MAVRAGNLLASLTLLSAAFVQAGTSSGGGTSGGSGSSVSGHGSGSGTGGAQASQYSTADVDNVLFATYLLISLACVVIVLAGYRAFLTCVKYVRTLTCLNNDSQNYYKIATPWYAWFKEHVVYAPLFRTRHHQELRLTKGWSLGILPTRFQALFLTAVIVMNVTLATKGIEWDQAGSTNMMGHLRNRCGTLAVVNLIPLVLIAGRNNPLIGILNLSFDTFNLIHRWLGRIVAAFAVTHFTVFAISHVQAMGWASLAEEIKESTLILTGLIGLIAFVVIMIQSSTTIRHAFYEFFLHLHILLVIMSLVALWYHLQDLEQLVYVQTAIGIWAAERSLRFITLLYRNFGNGGTKVVLEPLNGEAVLMTITIARPWNFRPGAYMYVTIPSIGLWTSHPFSLAWSSEKEEPQTPPDLDQDPEKGGVMVRTNPLGTGKITMSAIVRRRDGFTHFLFKKVQKAPGNRLVARAFVEGPYGGLHTLHSYGTVMLFAGGVGITHQMPYVRDLVVGYANGTVAARRVILVWIIQTPEHLEWIRPWMSTILALDGRRDILRVQLYVTQPKNAKEINSPSSTIQMIPGRPNLETIIDLEGEKQIGAMAVSVCGPGQLGDDLRKVVRRRQGRNIDFIEESFSW